MSGDNFITLTDDGNETGAVVVTATPSGANTGVERSAMIMFTTEGGTGAAATVVVMITQSAAPPTWGSYFSFYGYVGSRCSCGTNHYVYCGW